MAFGSRSREVVLPFSVSPELVKPATELRGTVLATSFALAREQGLESAYFERLPAELHERVRTAEPLSWVPMRVVIAHYRVMNALFPTEQQQIQNGRISSERTQNAYLRTVVRALQATGQVNPLTALKRMPSVIGRMVQGGGTLAVYTSGLKDARIELVGYPILDIDYIRNGWQGMFESGLSIVARKVFVKQDRVVGRPSSIAYDISWV